MVIELFALVINKTLNITFVINHIIELYRHLNMVVRMLPMKDILANKEMFQCEYIIKGMISNPTLTFEALKQFNEKIIFKLSYNDLLTLLDNDNFSLDELYYITQLVMDKNLGYFNENILSYSPNLTPRYILSHPEIDWSDKLSAIANNRMNYYKRKQWTNHLQKLYLQKLNKRVQSDMIDKNYLGANVLTNIVMEYK
jgi:hypothetical protein